MWNEKELMDELELYFTTVSKEQLISDLRETGSIEFMEEVVTPVVKLPDQDFNYCIEGSIVAQEVQILDSFEKINRGFCMTNLLYTQVQNFSSYYQMTSETLKEESTKQEKIELPIGA
jgi:hypothetical protein